MVKQKREQGTLGALAETRAEILERVTSGDMMRTTQTGNAIKLPGL